MFPVNFSFIPPTAENEMRWYLARAVDLIPSHAEKILISEYAERSRIMPSSSPVPGPWRNKLTPYLVEIMDNMSILSDVRHQAVMKAAQVGLTAAAENAILYWMDACPTKVLYMSATESMLKKWSITRLEPAIDSVGLRRKIYAQSGNANTRRTGDQTMMKEFVGGVLHMASHNSAASQRSDSVRFLCRDETDAAPALLDTGEGYWMEVSLARTDAYGDRAKVFDYSTPSTEDESAIYKQFIRGDQRYYHVACPHCGKYQPLEFGSEQASHGMRGETKAGELSDVYYLCQFCHEPIRDHHKQDMLESGYWLPTIEDPPDKYFRSYHISSLYSPAGMVSFEKVWRKYLTSLEDPVNGPRSFQTLTLGLPYKEVGQKPDARALIELRSTSYSSGQIPEGVLFLTAGIDVQRGSSDDRKRANPNPARLEMEICGHGAGFRTWSIDYKVFEGPVTDTSSGAWKELADYVNDRGFIYTRGDGREFKVEVTLIDSGDGELTNVVYDFCSNWRDTFPSKGFNWLQRNRKKAKTPNADVDDILDAMNIRKYRKSSVGESTTLVTISTNYYKHHTYRNLDNSRLRLESGEDHTGRCNFPSDYDDKYFRMLSAESKKMDGSFVCASGVRNEALDCRVLNLCAGDIYLDSLLSRLREELRRRGAKQPQIEAFRHKQILEHLERETKKI